MRKIYLFLIFAVASISLMAQSVELRIEDTNELVENNDTVTVYGVPNPDDGMIRTRLTVQNISDAAITMYAEREDLVLPENMSASFCFGVCYPPNTTTSNPVTLAAGEFLEADLDVDIVPVGNSGEVLVKVTIVNQADADDNIVFYSKTIIEPVGIEKSVSQLSLYPNPIVNVLNIDLRAENLMNPQVQIYDAVGKLVKARALSQKSTGIDVADMANGVYFVKIMDDNSVIETRKVVKR
ncbi:MAG: T9SS type A sorting domain-containing protein [Salinivirgaceae bacterium]|nr:T9SS type A sorting domain-containing protein [Salinivirgaceae bacterium]